MTGTPPAAYDVDPTLVRRLLSDQHPDLADAPIALLDVGWDNVMYRLGERYVVRLPRRKEAAALAMHEQRWLPTLGQQLPLPIPAPVRSGRPTADYPCPWTIIPWLPGQPADTQPPSPDQAEPLAQFLLALHQPAPADAPVNNFRGVPLSDRAKHLEERFGRLRGATELITSTILEIWGSAIDAPEAVESTWLHGDLHARNVLVDTGRISGIIDWGDLTSGDPATDLAAVWMLLPSPLARRDCLERYQASPDLIRRAMGWAVFFGAVLLETGLIDHPRHAAMGEAILKRLNEDARALKADG